MILLFYEFTCIVTIRIHMQKKKKKGTQLETLSLRHYDHFINP